MSERKIFCEECRNDVAFTISEKKMEGTIKGEKFRLIYDDEILELWKWMICRTLSNVAAVSS